jgi:ribosomal protein L31E
MKELIEQLMKEAGLTEKQALEAIRIIKEFAKRKFPVFGGAIDKLFDKYAPKQDDDFMD